MPTRYRFIIVLLLMGLPASALTGCTSRSAALRTCDSREMTTHAYSPAPGRLFTVPSLTFAPGSHRVPEDTWPAWEFDVRLVIDNQGQPACVEPETIKAATSPERQAVLQQAAAWRYKPMVQDGKAVGFSVVEKVVEEERLTSHQAVPQGPLATSEVTLRRTNCLGTCPAYAVRISGTGDVTFDGGYFVSVPDLLTYRIPQAEVAALVAAAADDDIWSVKDTYESEATDQPTYIVTITVGGQTKTIRDYAGPWVGMPSAVTRFENLIDTTAGTEDWIHLNSSSVTRLKSYGFNFHSTAGADIMAAAVDGEYPADDATILAVAREGAPLTGGKLSNYGPDYTRNINIIAALLRHHRQALADRLKAR